MATSIEPWISIGYEYSWPLGKIRKNFMRRSKRKAVCLVRQKTSNVANASAASATSTSAGKVNDDESEVEEDEAGDLSGDEESLHGPCNVRPPLADENKRFVK